jgi:hypothetical protein
MGFELDRAPVKFTPHFQKPVALFGGSLPVPVHECPPFSGRSIQFPSSPKGDEVLHVPTIFPILFFFGPIDSRCVYPNGFLCIEPLMDM